LKATLARMVIPAPVDSAAHALLALSRHEPDALDRLMPLVYAELHKLAHRQLKRLGGTPTVSTTVLVHEAYERLAQRATLSVDDERHLFRLCARVMRQIVIDHARERRAHKRGGGEAALTLDEAVAFAGDDPEVAARVSEVLNQLTELDPALAELAELAWLAGLDNAEIARLSGLNLRQVQRDLKRARAWVLNALE
jgi:RNA polymerase sigma factor (TIGR02999 family)